MFSAPARARAEQGHSAYDTGWGLAVKGRGWPSPSLGWTRTLAPKATQETSIGSVRVSGMAPRGYTDLASVRAQASLATALLLWLFRNTC